MRGWVGVKPAEPGIFPVQSGRFLVVPKFIYLNFGATYLSFGAVYLNFGARYLNFGARYLNFDAKFEIRVYFEWCRGGWVGPPGPPGGFVIGVGKKISAHPLHMTGWGFPVSLDHPRVRSMRMGFVVQRWKV